MYAGKTRHCTYHIVHITLYLIVSLIALVMFILKSLYIFISPYLDCRAALLPSMMDQIQNLLENTSELEFCVKLVSDILQITFRDDIVSRGENLKSVI